MFNYIKNKLELFTERELLDKKQRAYLYLYEMEEINIKEVLEYATEIEDYESLEYFVGRVRKSDKVIFDLAFEEALKNDRQPYKEISNRIFLEE